VIIAGIYHLSHKDMMVLKITDEYSIHRAMYSLFEDVRTEAEKNSSVSAGFTYSDKGNSNQGRDIYFMANREPKTDVVGIVTFMHIGDEFLSHEKYAFKITTTPTMMKNGSKKVIPIIGEAETKEWFSKKVSLGCGFTVDMQNLMVEKCTCKKFKGKGGSHISLSSADISGILTVTDRALFVKSVSEGIGRGKAFGHGMLQIKPL
jgi:CRISPR system Cascade subunit CasE